MGFVEDVEEEVEDAEEEELGHTETYADYMPAKCNVALYLSPIMNVLS